MDEAEWLAKKDDIVVLVEGIHNEDQITKFMCQQQNIREPFDNVQYKFFLIPDYQPDKSVVIMKAHHCFTDGLGFGAFLLMLSGNYDKNALPALKPLSFVKNVMIWLLMPYLFLKNALSIAFTFRNYNCIKKRWPMTGKKNGAFTNSLDIYAMKTYCKANGCTINDYTTSLISNTLYEYMENHPEIDGTNFEIPDFVSLGMPFSLRQPEARIEDFKIVNDFAAVPLNIKIRKTLNESLSILKKQFQQMRTSLDVFGVLQVFNFSVHLPFTLPRFGMDFISDKYTIIYSNLNASKVPYVFDGRRMFDQFYFVPACAKICCGISVCTVGPHMSMACFADENSIRNP